MNLFKSVSYVDTDKKNHDTNLKFKMLTYPLTKNSRFALYALKCGLVFEWVTQTEAFFSFALGLLKSRNLEQPWSSIFSTSLSITKLPKNLQFFVFLAN